MAREELFKEKDAEQTYWILRDVKEAQQTVAVCDCCGKVLKTVVSYGLKLTCSVECAMELSGDKPHIEKRSILDEKPKERNGDIYCVAS